MINNKVLKCNNCHQHISIDALISVIKVGIIVRIAYHTHIFTQKIVKNSEIKPHISHSSTSQPSCPLKPL